MNVSRLSPLYTGADSGNMYISLRIIFENQDLNNKIKQDTRVLLISRPNPDPLINYVFNNLKKINMCVLFV